MGIAGIQCIGAIVDIRLSGEVDMRIAGTEHRAALPGIADTMAAVVGSSALEGDSRVAEPAFRAAAILAAGSVGVVATDRFSAVLGLSHRLPRIFI
jgi:hypothetical protein